MGSKTFDGVRSFAYTNDHDPPHVHGTYGEVRIIVDLLPEQRAIRLSRRSKSVVPVSSKRSHVRKILTVARANFDDLLQLWENAR